MTDEQLDDLKQYIDGRISQTESLLNGRVNGLEGKFGGLEGKVDKGLENLKNEVNLLREEMRQGFEGVGDAMMVANEEFDTRITKLENIVAAKG